MIILAHRGFWLEPAEKNTADALRRAFDAGFGVETDIRDRDGRLVVSHDPAGAAAYPVEVLFDLYADAGRPGRLALNIKADGLARLLKPYIDDYGLAQSAFVFDMSVPDMRAYLDGPAALFTRFSDHEPDPVYYERSAGVWVDDFDNAFASIDRALEDVGRGKHAAIVSPELHGKPHEAAWDLWADRIARANPEPDQLMICTDLPDLASRVFERAAA